MGASNCRCLQGANKDTIEVQKRKSSKSKDKDILSMTTTEEFQRLNDQNQGQQSNQQASLNQSKDSQIKNSKADSVQESLIQNKTSGNNLRQLEDQLKSSGIQKSNIQEQHSTIPNKDDGYQQKQQFSKQQQETLSTQQQYEQSMAYNVDTQQNQDDYLDDSVEIERLERESKFETQSMMSDTTFRRMDNDGMNSSFSSQVVRMESHRDPRRGTQHSQVTDTSFTHQEFDNSEGVFEEDVEDSSDQFGDALFNKNNNSAKPRQRQNTTKIQSTAQKLAQKSHQLQQTKQSNNDDKYNYDSNQNQSLHGLDFNAMRNQDGQHGGSITSDSMLFGNNKAQINYADINQSESQQSRDQSTYLNEFNKSPSAAGKLFTDEFDNESQNSDNIFRKKKEGQLAARISVDSQDQVLNFGLNKTDLQSKNNQNLNDSNFNNLYEPNNNDLGSIDDNQSQNSDVIQKRKAKVIYE